MFGGEGGEAAAVAMATGEAIICSFWWKIIILTHKQTETEKEREREGEQ